MSRKIWIDPKTSRAQYDRRVERIDHPMIDNVFQAHRLLEAYANPIRHGMELSGTEQAAVKHAAKILRGQA